MSLPSHISSRESDKFVEDSSGNVTVRVVSTDSGPYYTIREIVGATLSYFGESRNMVDPSPTDPVWRLSRTTICGKITKTEYASPYFDQIWADRSSAFPVCVKSNIYSTSFDGIDDACSGGNVHNYDSSNAFSVSLWIKPDNLAAARVIISKAGPTPSVKGWYLTLETSGKITASLRANTTGSHTFNSVITEDVWQHIVFTYSGSGKLDGSMLYLNSTKDSSLVPSTSIVGSWLVGQDFLLASRNTSFFYVGNIDDVTVWDKALTQTEIDEIYNSGAPIDPTFHSANANLISWYRMGDSDAYPAIYDNVSNNDLTMVNMLANDFVEDTP